MGKKLGKRCVFFGGQVDGGIIGVDAWGESPVLLQHLDAEFHKVVRIGGG